MSMLEWAQREIEIASKKERGDKPEDEWDYGCACYESAFEAFKTLCGQGHSGFSIQMTKRILNRLIDGKPLTPIEDNEDIWRMSSESENEKSFQCKRMSSLFKDISADGTVSYHDTNRFAAIDAENGSGWYNNGMISFIGEGLYPVTMPYMPEDKPYRIYFEECLTDVKNGDFDTEAVLYLITPAGEKVEINRFFREPYDGEKPTYFNWVEIDRTEYEQRKSMDKRRQEAGL